MVRHRLEQRREDLEAYLAYLLQSEICRRAWGLPTPEGHAAKVREVRQALAALTERPEQEQLPLL